MSLGFDNKSEAWKTKSCNLLKDHTKLFGFVFMCAISVSLIQTSYAQTIGSSEQVTLSENLANDPVAQDLLKKIEQTKKMINELEQKEFEKNQAEENLKNMRDISVKQLNHSLDEWERLWEKHSSRNAFESFVGKKPSYVQGVFWDQFEFKEQKVNAGRIAMNHVLINGGTMQDAKNAYNKAASTQRIELFEVNAQINVKHNLANFAEQQLFNSTGKVHLSPVTKAKLTEMYSDYKKLPNFILANADNANIAKLKTSVGSDAECSDGYVLVSRITSESYSCIEEEMAKKWINNGVKGIVVYGDNLGNGSSSKVEANPATNCDEGYQVIYNIDESSYQCVLDSVAKEMIHDNAGEIHTLTEYILNKDKQRVTEDTIYKINQEIQRIQESYENEKKLLNSEYDLILENNNSLTKQKMQENVKQYRIDASLTKEDVSRIISEIRAENENNNEDILNQKSDALAKLKSELKIKILEVVNGYENHPDLNVDWDDLGKPLKESKVEENSIHTTVHTVENDFDELFLDNIGIVNSFGQKLDEIKSNQVLQIVADITNSNNYNQDFAYVLEIRDENNVLVEPSKWLTGTLNPSQTLNAGLSWIPKDAGEFSASISVGTQRDSVLKTAEIQIDVSPEGSISDGNYCKKDYELLFKYLDNSPICVKPDTAAKLMNIGLAFD